MRFELFSLVVFPCAHQHLIDSINLENTLKSCIKNSSIIYIPLYLSSMLANRLRINLDFSYTMKMVFINHGKIIIVSTIPIPTCSYTCLLPPHPLTTIKVRNHVSPPPITSPTICIKANKISTCLFGL